MTPAEYLEKSGLTKIGLAKLFHSVVGWRGSYRHIHRWVTGKKMSQGTQTMWKNFVERCPPERAKKLSEEPAK